MHNEIEEKRITDLKKKCKEAEKKKSIADMTDVVVAGGGRKRLAELAAEKTSSSSSSSSTSASTVTPSGKRGKTQGEKELDEEMAAIRESVAADISVARANGTALKLEREEAAQARILMAEMAASMAEFRYDLRDLLRKNR